MSNAPSSLRRNQRPAAAAAATGAKVTAATQHRIQAARAPQPTKLRPARRDTGYDRSTPERRAWGARLRTAREASGMSQVQASRALGFAQAVQLSNWENGNRPLHIEAVMQFADLYGTTTDYLCGMTDEVDRDPAMGMRRVADAFLVREMRNIAAGLSEQATEMTRRCLPTLIEAENLGRGALELCAAVDRVVASNKRAFDSTIRGGAEVVRKAEVVAATAADLVQKMARTRSASRATSAPGVLSALAGEPPAAGVSVFTMFDPQPVTVEA